MGRIRKIGSAHCNYSQILYQFLTFTQNLKRSRAGGPISTAAALQLTAATTNFAIYEHHFRSTQPAIARLGKYDYQPVNGKFYVSDRPGIGQELSEAAIAEALVHVTVDEP